MNENVNDPNGGITNCNGIAAAGTSGCTYAQTSSDSLPTAGALPGVDHMMVIQAYATTTNSPVRLVLDHVSFG